MKSTIYINGQPFIYENEINELTYEKITSITPEAGKKILFKTKELFNNIGLKFYLAYGTLLGAIREHDIIPGDQDVDIMINDENKLYENLPYLYENGLKLCRIQQGILYSFRIDKEAYIDVYIIKSLSFSIWKPYCYAIAGFITPKKYLQKYTEIEFLDDKFLCPQTPEKIIEFWYGKHWRIPQSGKSYYYEVKTAYYWKKIKRKIKKIIKFIIGYNYWKK